MLYDLYWQVYSILIKLKLLKKKFFPDPWRCPENIYNLVHTVDNYFIAIRALNAHGSEATQPISPHRREVFKSPLNERAAEHDVEGMTARMDATFELD